MSNVASNCVFVSPFRCRMWELHDRLETNIDEVTCRKEIESFAKHGQLVPALGRPIVDSEYDVELVCGARRLFVARHLNKELKVELREISDREAIIAMDIENRHRTDISPYERGLSFTRWIRGGYFESQDEVASALKISASQVSRLLKVARLPAVVVSAFESPADICEGWGLELMDALDDPSKRSATVQRARYLAASSTRLPARDVYRELVGASTGRRRGLKSRDEVVKDDGDAPLFRIRYHNNTIALVLPMTGVSDEQLGEIKDAVRHILRPALSNVATIGPMVARPHSPMAARPHLANYYRER